MIILGVNFGHNSSICIIKDGAILAAIEEEKVSRIKNDFFWPKSAINRLFDEYKIKYNDVDYISIQEDISSLLGKDNVNYRLSKRKFFIYKDFLNRTASYFGFSRRKTYYNNESFITSLKALGFNNAKVLFFDHHLSHAASAFYTSPFKSDLVVTCDGFGGTDAFNFYIPSKEGLKVLKSNNHSISVGQFYSMITALLGYKPNRHEGKITGLAAYGKPSILVDKFRELWKYNNNNHLERFPSNYDPNLIVKLTNKLSLKEKINYKTAGNKILNKYTYNNFLLREWLKIETANFTKEDIAYACQKISEEIILNEIKLVVDENFKSDNIKISLAGGVFANVRINQLIYELDFVENIFVHPAMADSGLAMGNAILAFFNLNNKINKTNNLFKINHSYYGPDYSKDLISFVDKFSDSTIDFCKMEDAPSQIAKLLFENKIVGFWSNRLEWGPRALGARSILLNTFDKSVNDSLNKRLNRTEFMPFAPVVLDFMAKKYFPKYNSNIPAADYMTITYDTAKDFHKQLQAVVHVDGTARPQVIRRETNTYYYDILNRFYDISGCGALVNTSFNAHEEPILSDPYTGINALKNNRIDVLVMEDYIFTKKI
ncbi:hypothetical protein OAJ32_00325 [bacterium]|nr:hypothetical protein [bacterium]